ncbi:MAG: hypothetical protein DWQ06_02955 [Calditrichaeota bacterium]|nr:MAG: hypothetical protein DWQ06_02955 [Calditrichota bacterium]
MAEKLKFQELYPETTLNEKQEISANSAYNELFKKISHLSPEVYAIFDIARILNSTESPYGEELSFLSLSSKEEEKEDKKTPQSPLTEIANTGVDDWFIDSMSSLNQIPNVLKKQFLLPEEIFMRKLVYKDLLIKKHFSEQRCLMWNEVFDELSQDSPIKKAKKQKTYILMDVSKSTEKRNRILLEKAISLSFLENNNKEHGEVYFRAFNQEVGKLYFSRNPVEYKKVLNEGIIPAFSDGSTNLQHAIDKAIEDINFYSIDTKAEILILTDGLVLIDLEEIEKKAKDIKFNIVLIGDDEVYLTDDEFEQQYKKTYAKDLAKFKGEGISPQKTQVLIEAHKNKFFAKKSLAKDLKEDRFRQLEHLAENHSGKFIQIKDLPSDLFDYEKIIENVKSELKELESKLLSENYTPREKEELLQQFLALKNYINGISKQKKLTSEQQNQLKEMSKEMKDLVEKNEDLLDLLKESNVILQLSSKGMTQMMEMNLGVIFKLLFHRMKLYFYQTIHKEK